MCWRELKDIELDLIRKLLSNELIYNSNFLYVESHVEEILIKTVVIKGWEV